jgi:hypothetical protein
MNSEHGEYILTIKQLQKDPYFSAEQQRISEQAETPES